MTAIHEPLTQTGPEIALAKVSKTFGAVRAVDSVDLVVSAGSFTALVGASGSGKSTLLKMINRLEEPDAGTISFDGHSVAGEPSHMLRRQVGYVFQNIGLFPHLSVAENIAIGLKITGHRATQKRVAAMLHLVDLPLDFQSRRPNALSGGQAQRVGIARALAADPRVLLMDEPFGALDPVTRDTLGQKVRALHEGFGLTTVMVTHDMAEALLLADRVLVMQEGKIVADGTPRDLLAGRGGAAADALLAVPRRQSHALAALGA